MFKSLHKNLELEKQPSERINSGTSNKQIDLNTSNVMEDGNHFFDDGELSNIESSVLNTLNQSLIGSSSVENKKKNSPKNEENLLERNNLIVTYKLSNNQTSISTNNSQILAEDISSITSQQSSNHLSKNEILVTNKPLTATNPCVKEKSVSQKRKISSSATDSDSDLESLSNKYMKKKKKHDKVTINARKQYTGQNNNNTNSSNKKLLFLNHVSSTKPMIVPNIPQKELQNKSSILIYFLKKCGIMLSTDGICILSTFFIIHFLFN